MSIIGELLLSFLDIAIVPFEIFDPYETYSVPLKDYKKWRESHHLSPTQAGRLISGGYIKNDNRGSYAITPKARRLLAEIVEKNLVISKSSKWDGIWRVVIFDIPEAKRYQRDLFRSKLKALGLELIQKSVFCHPHDCFKEVITLAKLYEVDRHVTYMEVSSIVTDKNIFESFEKKGFLN